jgi:hypothetical protein
MEDCREKDEMDRKLMRKVVNTMFERRFNLLQYNEKLRETTDKLWNSILDVKEDNHQTRSCQ